MRKQNLKIRGGKLSNGLELSRGPVVYGLFLFQILSLVRRYIENLSHAQVMARASFSICA